MMNAPAPSSAKVSRATVKVKRRRPSMLVTFSASARVSRSWNEMRRPKATMMSDEMVM
jgi:hypothetical protein